jgi:rod shape-determining protein MreD
VVALMVRGFSGEAMPQATFWIAPWIGALVWPLLFLLFDALRSHARA